MAKNAGDCAAAGLSSSVCNESAAARQNVAIWFSYYRTRILMAKSSLMSAFNTLNAKYRFGFGSINGGNNGALPSPRVRFGNNKIAEVQPFGDGSSGTQKAAFWNWVATMVPPEKSTPLRDSLKAVGEYYQTSQPWSTMPGDPGYVSGGANPAYACRASYTLLTTDGFWNGGSPHVGNADETAGNTYTSVTGTTLGYTVVQPFEGDTSNTLADVANYYWKTDLNTNLDNEVPPRPPADPAFWQHMTTFTMGLGFTPVGISPAGTTIPQIFAWAQGGNAIANFAWPAPSASGGGSEYNIADLAHAAVNGHGDFFSAKNPNQMVQGISKTIGEIKNGQGQPRPVR